MKATGTIEIEEGLILLNPEMEIVKSTYDWLNDTVQVECYFTEGLYKHSRTFEFDNSLKKELTSTDIVALIIGHPKLDKFVEKVAPLNKRREGPILDFTEDEVTTGTSSTTKKDKIKKLTFSERCRLIIKAVKLKLRKLFKK